MTTFGEAMRKGRESRKLSLANLATGTGIAETKLQEYENEIQIPDIIAATAIGNQIGIDQQYCVDLLSASKMRELQKRVRVARDDLEKPKGT